MAVLFPNIEGSQEWLSTAIERLLRMVTLQIFDDGMHNEQCSMYHHEVLNCLFECVRLLDINKIQYPKLLKDKLDKMFTASLTFIKPNGHQPMLSDSDDTDIRDIITQGAVLFQSGDLKSMAYSTLNYEGIWYFGKEGVELFSTIPSGREFLIDSGRYTYLENKDRKYFKESFQHNTLTVDGAPISSYCDAWTWSNVAIPLNSYWVTHSDFDYVQGGHNGYWKLEKPVQILRQILYVKPDYWVLIDTCYSKARC